MYQDLMMDAHIEEMFSYQPDHYQYSQIDIIQNLKPFVVYGYAIFYMFWKSLLIGFLVDKDQQVMIKR